MQNNLHKMMSTLKNGILIKTAFIYQKNKKNNKELLNILWDEGFILGYKLSSKNPNKLKIFLKYQNGNPVIKLIKTISKPRLRIYYSVKNLWKLDPSIGLLVLSTNKGFMSSLQCKKQIVGGEPFILIK